MCIHTSTYVMFVAPLSTRTAAPAATGWPSLV